MTVADKIRKAMKEFMSEAEVNACYVGKGYHYDGAIESNGWHYIPFNGTAVHLGENKDEALETLEQMSEEAEAIHSYYMSVQRNQQINQLGNPSQSVEGAKETK